MSTCDEVAIFKPHDSYPNSVQLHLSMKHIAIYMYLQARPSLILDDGDSVIRQNVDNVFYINISIVFL